MTTLAEQPPPEGGEAGWHSDPLGSDKLRYFDGTAWTDRIHKVEAMAPAKKGGGFPRPRPHWRKMTWVLIGWSLLIVIWAIGGGSSTNCGSKPSQLQREACESGTGIGVAIVLVFGFLGFVFLSLIWFMTRPKGRTCPACGEHVKKGRTTCPQCGHDFAAAAMMSPPPPPAAT